MKSFGHVFAYLWAASLLIQHIDCQSKVANLKLAENNIRRVRVGNIFDYIEGRPDRNGQSFLIAESKIFDVDSSGDILVLPLFDLENICTQMFKCCGGEVCQINSDVTVFNSGQLADSVTLKLTLTDLNDNKPKFTTGPFQSFAIPENAEVGYTKTVSGAGDSDYTDANRVKTYRLKNEGDVFQLDSSGPSLFVRLLKKLDYELQNKYMMKLEACDVDFCTSQDLIVNVTDVNDNHPVFDRKEYQLNLKENEKTEGDNILRVKASDSDSGVNGKIRYEIDSQDAYLKTVFEIDPQTGDIKLKSKPNANIRSEFRFNVRAVNPNTNYYGPPSASNMASVVVTIEDANDNAPQIELLSNTRTEIAENIPEKSGIVNIKVSDNDIGDNAKVTCQLVGDSNSKFRLKGFRSGIYSLDTIRSFDYEASRAEIAKVACRDGGTPQLTSTLDITVLVSDVNEYAPQFSQNIYRHDITENERPGKEIIQVQATDSDGSAELVYSIGRTPFFTINEKTGLIMTTSEGIDYESVQSIEFQVHVKDSKNLSLARSDTATVRIKVVDLNDNDPKFTSPSVFEIRENLHVGAEVNGRLTATDADSPKNGQEITFSLRQTWNRNGQVINGFFEVSKAGRITAQQKLDHEQYSNNLFTLNVAALDYGSPHRQTLANITIRVLDENDNSPEWEFPHSPDNTINVTTAIKPGDLVTKVFAKDRDSGENSRILYSFRDNKQDFIYLNNITGQLIVSKPLIPGQLKLYLRARDNGQPKSQYSDTMLIVNIQGSQHLNFTVIIIMIGVTAVISLCLISAIICVRKFSYMGNRGWVHTNSASPPGSDMAKDQMAATWAFHHEDSNCLDGNMYMTQHMSMNHPDTASMTMHTFGSTPDARHYGTLNPYAPQNEVGRIYNFDHRGFPYEIVDGDSADSGRGASEDDPNRYAIDPMKSHAFSPVQFHNRPPSRGNPSNPQSAGRVTSPAPATSTPCQCYILPEDGVIQCGHSNQCASRPLLASPGHHPYSSAASDSGLYPPPSPGMPPPMMPLNFTTGTFASNSNSSLPPPPAYNTLSMSRSPRRPYQNNVPIGGIKVMDDNMLTFRGISSASPGPPTAARPRIFTNPIGEVNTTSSGSTFTGTSNPVAQDESPVTPGDRNNSSADLAESDTQSDNQTVINNCVATTTSTQQAGVSVSSTSSPPDTSMSGFPATSSSTNLNPGIQGTTAKPPIKSSLFTFKKNSQNNSSNNSVGNRLISNAGNNS